MSILYNYRHCERKSRRGCFESLVSLRAQRSGDPQSTDNQHSITMGWRVKPAMTAFQDSRFALAMTNKKTNQYEKSNRNRRNHFRHYFQE